MRAVRTCSVEKGGKGNLTVEKADTARPGDQGTSSLESTHPWHDVMRTAVQLCGLPPQNTESQPNSEKNIKHAPAEGCSTKLLTRTPQDVRIIKNREQTGGAQGAMSTRHTVGSWTGKRTSGKHWSNVSEVCTLVTMYEYRLLVVTNVKRENWAKDTQELFVPSLQLSCKSTFVLKEKVYG